jgi:hypothetical protein
MEILDKQDRSATPTFGLRTKSFCAGKGGQLVGDD